MRPFQILVFISCIFILVFTIEATAQRYVADTIFVDVKPINYGSFFNPVKAVDLRTEPQQLISVFEKKKWMMFPVDQIVVVPRPLHTYFQNNAPSDTIFQLGIHEFYLHYDESWFKKRITLNAYLELEQINKQRDTAYRGIFYYEQSKVFANSDTLTQCYQEMWMGFSKGFASDMRALNAQNFSSSNESAFHFRKGKKAAGKNFYVATDLYYGLTFYGLDAEIWFSAPEMAQKFKRGVRMFRFLHFDNRQSVAFSTHMSQFNYRINNNWLFQNKQGFILGFNKWNDVDEAKRTFEELFLFQYTFSQRVVYNRLDKKGLVFGLGLMEELSYIFYNKPMLNVAASINCTYKF